MISNANRTIQIGLISSEQQLAAETDVEVLRIVVAFFTIGLRIETEVFRHLPVKIDAVVPEFPAGFDSHVGRGFV